MSGVAFMFSISTVKAKQPRGLFFFLLAWVTLTGEHLEIILGSRVTCDSGEDAYFEAGVQMPAR